MKKILIVIHDMRIGGAQKSLLSFLQSLSASEAGKKYAVDLMVIDPTGPFMQEMPENVRILPPPAELRWAGTALSRSLIQKYFTWRSFFGELGWLVKKRLGKFPKALNLQQKLWLCWERRIPPLEDSYDTVISYMDGIPNYYAVDKVSANKKILWIHSEYQKQGYDARYDCPYFEKAHGIITISESCRQCILQEFPGMENKVYVLENITSHKAVTEKSIAGLCPEFQNADGLKLLTVGRLNPQKGIDLAVQAAAILKQREIPFLWLVAGDGPEYDSLCRLIEDEGLQEQFRLLGSRENPYVYMKACDILVQPSRVEGKSIVLDEAKILEKAIVATNYTTVADSLVHGQTGWVVDMTPQGLAQGILHLWQNPELCGALRENLRALPNSEHILLQRYIDIMFE